MHHHTQPQLCFLLFIDFNVCVYLEHARMYAYGGEGSMSASVVLHQYLLTQIL